MKTKTWMRTPSQPAGVALVAAVLATLFLSSGRAFAQAGAFTRVEQGRYLMRAGDCESCHTADDKHPFAGGKPIPTPFGTIYSANITPDKSTGIGNWSADDFYRAMHSGIDNDGKHLYPAFPYPWFTKMPRRDVDAVRAFLATVKPVRNEVRKPELPWPMSWRGSVAAWNALYLHAGEYKVDPKKSAEWNRGAYLVEGPGHCGACHTPKNVLGATKRDEAFEGGSAGEHWYAPRLTRDLREGIGGWTKDEIVEYLKTGSNAKAAASGEMKEVVKYSTQHLTTSDLQSIAAYLRDLPGDDSSTQEAKSASTVKNDVATRGEAVYLDNCTGCHMADGRGQPGIFPPLRGNAAVQASTPDSVVHVVVEGSHTVASAAKPTGLAMPAYAGKLTDEQIADVISYVRSAWGNAAAPVGTDTVAAVRKIAKIGYNDRDSVRRPDALTTAQRH